MAEYVLKSAVHHTQKGKPGVGQLGDVDYVPPKPGKMSKLEMGDACPSELVSELLPLGLLAPKGSHLAAPNFGKGVQVGEAGEVGKYEDLPAKDEEKEEKSGKYASRKKGK